MTETLTEAAVRAMLPPRPADSHKGTFGRAVIAGGHYGMAGAPLLAARAALRTGVGLAEVAVPQRVYPLLAAAVPEAIFTPLPEDDTGGLTAASADALLPRLSAAGALVLGCGMGQGHGVTVLCRAVLPVAPCPVVLDADGINALDRHILSTVERKAPLVLTPHPGEMARLWGVSTAAVQASRAHYAAETARSCRAVTVLKGHHTLIALPDGHLYLNPTGNAGMATGGSGDALAGMIGSLLAQGLPPAQAACAGVYLHGLAGDRAAARLSQTALLPSDLIDELCRLFADWGR